MKSDNSMLARMKLVVVQSPRGVTRIVTSVHCVHEKTAP